jgi:hypothetical protein
MASIRYASRRYTYAQYHVPVRTRLWAVARIAISTVLAGLALGAAVVLLVLWVADASR